jgi:hypothetical protein
MKKLAIATAGMLAGGLAQADKLEGMDEMICSAVQVQTCIENYTCYSAAPTELDVPDFVVIDTKKKTISTNKTISENGSTRFFSVEKSTGLIYLIDAATSRMTVSIARDGISVSVFGACTSTDL